MKQFNWFFMLLIGMISFTVMANTTATPEPKQKTEVVQQFSAVTNDVIVVADFQLASLIIDANDVQCNLYFVDKEDARVFSKSGLNAVLVGSNQNTVKKHYRQKLKDNYNLHFTQNSLKLYKSIRADC